ncbi:MAG: amidohydrolase family protein [Pseudomonadota bacterium]
MIEKENSSIEDRMRWADPARLAPSCEPAIEPELPIIDPHHHLWDFPGHRYLLPDLLEDTGSGHNIVATVFIECAAFFRQDGPEHMRSLGEVEFVNGIAAMAASGRYGPTKAAVGIVGTADLTRGAAVEEVLQAQIAAGGGRYKGIRHSAGWEDKTRSIHMSHSNPPQHLYRDHTKFREGFAVLGKLGLSFDAWLYHPQLEDVISLAQAFPDQPIVMNHVGGPLGREYFADRREEVFTEWKAGITELATCENVCVKLGGLGMRINGFAFEDQPTAPSSDDLAAAWRPFIETAIEAFGPDRAMFESNFPVDKISGSYVNYWNAFKKLAAGTSESERTALFHDTAKRFYRL